MNRWGCYGLVLGGLIGALLVALFVAVTRPAPPDAVTPPPTIPPDATVFVSERIVNRIAAQSLDRPAVIDFDENGQMRVTTRSRIGRLEPVVQAAILLEMEGTEVTSTLRWLRLGFLYFPAGWLPGDVQETTALIGQTIKEQTPPDFRLVGLSTTNDGITFQLKWVGP